MKKSVFRLTALAEFDEAVAWYENQRTGLGYDFVAEIENVLTLITQNPKRYPIADGDVREAPVTRFPYCIYYRDKQDRVVILSVFHTSRDPALWQGRQ